MQYAFNYDYIVSVLCVNKDKPQMQCNGKCHLTKMVAKNTDTDSKKDMPTSKLEVLFTPLFFQEVTSVPMIPIFNEWKKNTIAYENEVYSFAFINTLFKPPIA